MLCPSPARLLNLPGRGQMHERPFKAPQYIIRVNKPFAVSRRNSEFSDCQSPFFCDPSGSEHRRLGSFRNFLAKAREDHPVEVKSNQSPLFRLNLAEKGYLQRAWWCESCRGGKAS